MTQRFRRFFKGRNARKKSRVADRGLLCVSYLTDVADDGSDLGGVSNNREECQQCRESGCQPGIR